MGSIFKIECVYDSKKLTFGFFSLFFKIELLFCKKLKQPFCPSQQNVCCVHETCPDMSQEKVNTRSSHKMSPKRSKRWKNVTQKKIHSEIQNSQKKYHLRRSFFFTKKISSMALKQEI